MAAFILIVLKFFYKVGKFLLYGCSIVIPHDFKI